MINDPVVRSICPTFNLPSTTPFTHLQNPLHPSSEKLFRSDRPALLVSSTSWTADEDMYIFLDALRIYNNLAVKKLKGNLLPNLLVVITGKGPMKADFEMRVQAMEAGDEMKVVRVRTAWLELADYPKLLGKLLALARLSLLNAVQARPISEFRYTQVHPVWIYR